MIHIIIWKFLPNIFCASHCHARARHALCTRKDKQSWSRLRKKMRGGKTKRGVQYTVKKGQRFSRPQPGCHLPNSPWPGKIKLSTARESLVSDIPAGDGKTANLFLQCSAQWFLDVPQLLSFDRKCALNSKAFRKRFNHSQRIFLQSLKTVYYYEHNFKKIHFGSISDS